MVLPRLRFVCVHYNAVVCFDKPPLEADGRVARTPVALRRPLHFLTTSTHMKTSYQILAAVAAALTSVAFAASNIQVKVENKCGETTKYTIQKKGSTTNTSLSARSSTTHSLEPGDRIWVGKTLVHTVSSSSASTTAVICSK